MRIAFIGHSYHQHTRSSEFFVELLTALGTVDLFFDESWCSKQTPWVEHFDSGAYDCVIIWQVHQAFQYIRWPHPNVIFAPMYDAMIGGGRFLWTDIFNRAKILCFSSHLQREVSRHSGHAKHFKYYLDPSRYSNAAEAAGLRGIFWKRVPAINETIVGRLCEPVVFDRFTIHEAFDPMSGAQAMAEIPILSREYQRTPWQQRWEDYLKIVAEHNVFFASRPYEGIGMSLLEAMAMGLCVVAPDTPTHNEYVSHGTTGLLYDWKDPQPLSFAAVRDLGARARESMQTGFERWSASLDQLLDFIVTPTPDSDRLICR